MSRVEESVSLLGGFDALAALNQVAVPDLWQQQAVQALREGKDVIVHAPTGAGKTLIFELWSNQGKNRGQAIYTVPTRALANDKLAEWRGRGWNVGIATGDLSDNLSAPVIVATLETQKGRLIRGDGPSLLVVDEYQMLGDHDRGLNYELAMAMAPPGTQLLLLSGSVANPQQVVQWLSRLGRKVQLIRHEQRPVPQEEIYANNLSYHLPSDIQGYWPRLVAKALAEDLGPILIFAPRRQAAESMAAELARYLPTPNPLALTPEQKLVCGEHLAKLLKSRVTYHHSGLSYQCRAGLIEPLAKAGQLRVVVATMGLAAGINFSLRSVALAGDSYRRDQVEQALRGDEILQMFGRAGRRGLDETGYVLISSNGLRLLDARPAQLARSASVDWSALLGLMAAASDVGLDPFSEAVRVQERLFTTKPIFLGVEQSLKAPEVPCGLRTDPERARLVRKRVRQMLNSRGEWQNIPPCEPRPISSIFFQPRLEPGQGAPPPMRPLLTEKAALDKVGQGVLVPIEPSDGSAPVYARAMFVAETLANGKILLGKWVRRLTNWPYRQTTRELWETQIKGMVASGLTKQNLPVLRFDWIGEQVFAVVSLAEQTLKVPIDAAGVALWHPPEREVLPTECSDCPEVPVCRELPTNTGTALLWRRLRLIDAAGHPTRRGRLVSFFSGGDGLAIAAALEDSAYPIEELAFDLANLDAGFRFCGEDARFAGPLAMACHSAYETLSVAGYLENGLPPKYGSGAEVVVRAAYRNPQGRHAFITPLLGAGDIDRMIIEWRSLMRQISHAPPLAWARWTELQSRARNMLNDTESPTKTDLPALPYVQTRRIDHRLILRRH